MFWAIPDVNLPAGGAAVTVILGLGYCMGIMTLVNALTDQQTIRVIRSHFGLQRFNRDDRFEYLLAVSGGFFALSWAIS